MKILIVDDEPSTRLTVASTVERLGHRALQATDGAEAFNAFQMFRPEVVITDWEMPGMSGTDLAARIRAAEPNYTYIMVLTGRADETASREAVQLGADDVLVQAARRRRDRARADRRRADHVDAPPDARRRALRPADRRGLALAPGRGPDGAVRAGRALRARLLHGDGRASSRPTNDVLARAGRALVHEIRSGDAVYRSGPEPFVVLLPEQALDTANLAAARLRRAVESCGRPATPRSASGS